MNLIVNLYLWELNWKKRTNYLATLGSLIISFLMEKYILRNFDLETFTQKDKTKNLSYSLGKIKFRYQRETKEMRLIM